MPEALKHLLRARIVGFTREPEAVFWTFGFPILIAVALGIAFRNKPPDRIDVAVIAAGPVAVASNGAPDEIAAPPVSLTTAVGVQRALVADSALTVTIVSAPEAHEALRTGKAALAVVPGDPVTFRFDPTRPESRVARLEVEDALDRARGRAPAYRAADEHVAEPGSRYIDFLVPGLIGMNVMSASMWGIGWSLVEARSRKLLKRLAATPMPRSYYLGSFILAHLILVTALLVVFLAFSRIAFGVRIFGNVLSLYLVAMLGAASFAGLGILMASRTDNSETLSGLNNAAMLPMFVASGVFFSSSHFPAVVQPLIRILPLTALNDALRGIMTDGHSLFSLGPEIAVLAIWGVLCFALALRWFRWT